MSFDLLPTIADILDLPVPWASTAPRPDRPASTARGDEKLIYDISGFAKFTLDAILEWHDGDQFPTADNRWIGPLRDPADPLSGLNDLLDVGLDRRHARWTISIPSPATMPRSTPSTTSSTRRRQPPAALVTGRVPGAPSDAEVVIAINGVVVGGSKVSTDSDGRDGRIAVLLPQDVLERENEVRAALVVDGEVRELEVVEGGPSGCRDSAGPSAGCHRPAGATRSSRSVPGPERASGWAGGCHRSA